MKPAISIICPIYNMEASLRKCIDSIRLQTFNNFELILIDDGSTDHCGLICDEYAHIDSRIIVIHKINAGVSAARQTGLATAKGEYTIHIDPDDWVEPEMLEILYREAREGDYDFIIADFFVNSEDKQFYKSQKPSALDHVSVLHDVFKGFHANCWNKLIRRSCYFKFGVQFPANLSLREDFCVIVQLLLHPLKIAYVNQAFYHYEQTPNSISRTINNKMYEDQMMVIENIASYLNGQFPECLNILKSDVACWLVETGYKTSKDVRREFAELLQFQNYLQLPLNRQIKVLVAFFFNKNITKKVRGFVSKIKNMVR